MDFSIFMEMRMALNLVFAKVFAKVAQTANFSFFRVHLLLSSAAYFRANFRENMHKWRKI
jgi:hypothetical protein